MSMQQSVGKGTSQAAISLPSSSQYELVHSIDVTAVSSYQSQNYYWFESKYDYKLLIDSLTYSSTGNGNWLQLTVGTGTVPTFQASSYVYQAGNNYYAEDLSTAAWSSATSFNPEAQGGGAGTQWQTSYFQMNYSDGHNTFGGNYNTNKTVAMTFSRPAENIIHEFRSEYMARGLTNVNVALQRMGWITGRYNSATPLTAIKIVPMAGTFSGRITMTRYRMLP